MQFVRNADQFILRVLQPISGAFASPFVTARFLAYAGGCVAALNALLGLVMLSLSPLFNLPLALAITFVITRVAARLEKTVDIGERNAFGARLRWPRIIGVGFLLFAAAPLIVFGKSLMTILLVLEIACFVIALYYVSCDRHRAFV